MLSPFKQNLMFLGLVALLTGAAAFGQSSPQSKNAEQTYTPTILRRAGTYSQEKQVVVVLVSKGYKEELDLETKTPLTGKEIGNSYASELHHKYGVSVGVMEDKETRPTPYI